MFNNFVKLFALLLPITTILVIPQIQGTTPGLMMALLSPFVVLLAVRKNVRRYFIDITILLYFFVLLVLLSQLALLLDSHGSDANLKLIQPGALEPFRITIITQSLYLLSGLFTFILFLNFYTKNFDNVIITGGIFLATIGIFDWIFFLFFNGTLDVLSNRVFGEENRGLTSFQVVVISGHEIMRLRSLTGEPSMYALSIFPYFVFCIAIRRHFCAYFFLLTLLLSTSTAGMLGLLVFGVLYVLFIVKGLSMKLAWSAVLFAMIGGLILMFTDVFVEMVAKKLALENASGADRFSEFTNHLSFWLNGGFLLQIFGIGWGTIRSADMVSTLLVNSGLVGMACYLSLFLKPLVDIRRQQTDLVILFIGMLAVLIMLLVSVSEYSYLPTWVFLGILYKKITLSAVSCSASQNHVG